MAYVKYNPNPNKIRVGDCVIRSLALATGSDWESTYVKLVFYGFKMADMPSSNHVWGSFLIDHGFARRELPSEHCGNYTVKNFCKDHPRGLYVIATGSHVVTAINGNYYDSWNSGDEIITYFFEREVNKNG